MSRRVRWGGRELAWVYMSHSRPFHLRLSLCNILSLLDSLFSDSTSKVIWRYFPRTTLESARKKIALDPRACQMRQLFKRDDFFLISRTCKIQLNLTRCHCGLICYYYTDNEHGKYHYKTRKN